MASKFSFGVLYLAAVAEAADCHVEIFPVAHRQTGLNLEGFDIVGFSIPSSATYSILKNVRFGSTYSDKALILVGGLHATLFPKETFHNFAPDLLVIGEALDTLAEIINNYRKRNFEDVKGLYYLRGDNLVSTPKRPSELSLDRYPRPARHLLPMENFIMTDRLSDSSLKMTHMVFSRGCPFNCTFCGTAQTPISYRSGLNIRDELLHLIRTYGIEGFAVTDDNFLIKKQKVKAIALKIANLDLRWSALSRIDTVDEETLRCISAAGCIEIKFGIESGSQRILQAMNKHITKEQVVTTLSLAKSLGLNVKIFIIHGFPGENYESTIETIKLLSGQRKKIDRVSLFRFVPLPGSRVFSEPQRYGLKPPKMLSNGEIDWSIYRIYHNPRHWWGTKTDYDEVN